MIGENPSTVSNSIDYLMLGSITRDVSASGNYSLGGTASYSGLMANTLGLRVGIVSSMNADLNLLPLEKYGILVARQHSDVTTEYQNIYTDAGRVQYLRKRASSLTFDSVPARWLTAPIVHIGPLANDIDQSITHQFSDTFVGITLQGWLRKWDHDGRIIRSAFPKLTEVISKADAVVLSIEDVDGDWDYIERCAAVSKVLVITESDKGATVFGGGKRHQFQAPNVVMKDSTGAGDIFASVFFVLYYHTRDYRLAARLAVKIASDSVTREGLKSVPSKVDISISNLINN
ncbi:MAG: PfkB family carbohydrate kinase [Anaerolineales bacterium]|nr:PfkB family carbohydrate kinase [Anaerolineales bacterium]